MSEDGSITLHPTLGVNCHMTACVRCGGEGQELVMLGHANSIYKCHSCGRTVLETRHKRACPMCGGAFQYERELDQWERVPMGLCKECETQEREFAAEVERGGVHWKCADCGQSGVIKADTEFSRHIRESHGMPAPKPIGVEFDKNKCPACQGKKPGEVGG